MILPYIPPNLKYVVMGGLFKWRCRSLSLSLEVGDLAFKPPSRIPIESPTPMTECNAQGSNLKRQGGKAAVFNTHQSGRDRDRLFDFEFVRVV